MISEVARQNNVSDVSSKTIADAIAETVKLRYDGPKADVQYLKTLISEGIKENGGQAVKGSSLQFDCSNDGVAVSVDGAKQGTANFAGLGGSFVDIFVDENTVSPSLVDDCLNRYNEEQDGGPKGDISDAVGEQSDSESRKTMLSLRILMKKLSGWTLPKQTDNGSDVKESDDQAKSGEFEQQNIDDTDSCSDAADSNVEILAPLPNPAEADGEIEVEETESISSDALVRYLDAPRLIHLIRKRQGMHN